MEELAAALYYLQKAESSAESEEVKEVLRESLEWMDQRLNDVVGEIGKQEYESDG